MISLEKWYTLTPFQKLPKNAGDLGKLNVAKGFIKFPKVQLIAQSGHTEQPPPFALIMELFYRRRWRLVGICSSGKLLCLWNAKTLETMHKWK